MKNFEESKASLSSENLRNLSTWNGMSVESNSSEKSGLKEEEIKSDLSLFNLTDYSISESSK